ncbi:MAG TPA: hypothetical protein VFV52_09780 [Bacilli bacterium]|nr:hypothetical protein [Bacilli bacterium]
MQLFRFDAAVGRPITAFGSQQVTLSPLHRFPQQMRGSLSVVCMHVAPGGCIGYHPAATKQLFLIMQGEGWVRGEEETRTPLQAGNLSPLAVKP